MPREVDTRVFRIAQTRVDRLAVRRWLDDLGAPGFEIPPNETVSDPALLVALAAKQCYLSFEPGLNPNVTRVRRDYVEYFDNLLRSGHGSVFEHAVFTYGINGVSRVFTGEMNRHRAGWGISERSMRFIRYEEIPYWLPTSLRPHPGDDEDLARRKHRSRAILARSFREDEKNYADFMATWEMDEGNHNFHYKKIVTSAARRVIGMGVATGGVWTGNVRALRHVLALRTDPAAEEEIFDVFSKIGDDVVASEPLLFGDFERTAAGAFVPTNRKV